MEEGGPIDESFVESHEGRNNESRLVASLPSTRNDEGSTGLSGLSGESPHLSAVFTECSLKELPLADNERDGDNMKGEGSVLSSDSLDLSPLLKDSVSKYRVRYDWNVMYDALLDYGREHGHYNVPRRHVCKLPEGTKSLGETFHPIETAPLGSWLTSQRADRLSNKLKPDRLQLLQTLVNQGKLDWSPPNALKESDTLWPYMFECLSDYCQSKQAERGGDFAVSSFPEKLKWIHPVTKEELGLGRWMHTQFKRRRENRLRQDRMNMFQQLIDQKKFRWPQVRKAKASVKENLQVPYPHHSSNGNNNQSRSNEYTYVPSADYQHPINPLSSYYQRQTLTQSMFVSSNSSYPAQLRPLPELDVERYNPSTYNTNANSQLSHNIGNGSRQSSSQQQLHPHPQHMLNHSSTLHQQLLGNHQMQQPHQQALAGFGFSAFPIQALLVNPGYPIMLASQANHNNLTLTHALE
jgi:hypothetical protein